MTKTYKRERGSNTSLDLLQKKKNNKDRGRHINKHIKIEKIVKRILCIYMDGWM